jgi:RNA polymerase sigma-70 factor (ECF subfamily)
MSRPNRAHEQLSGLTDPALVERVAQGDRTAFLELYDRHASRVFALAARMLGDRASAEEVTQDAFLKLWTRARAFSPSRGALLAWLLTITRNNALDRIRLEARRPVLTEVSLFDLEDGGRDLQSPESGSEEARWRSLRFALAELPDGQRRVIELAFYQGLSHSQMAEILGVPLGTVKTRLRLGMERLRATWIEDRPARTRSERAGSHVKGKRSRAGGP